MSGPFVPLTMFQPALDSLLSLAFFSPEELILFESKLTRMELHAGDYLLQTGETCHGIYFLLEGTAVHSILLQEGKENILNLYTPGDWLTDYTSFTSQNPSVASIRVNTNAKFACMDIHSIHDLIQADPTFFRAGRLLEKMQYTDVATMHLTPDEKYLHLLTHRPALLQAFPLKTIASYLRLTPETLSRIRARIS